MSENQKQSVEGWSEIQQWLDYLVQTGYVNAKYDIFQLLSQQQLEVVEKMRKICMEKKVTNDFAKRHPESYKYELGWDAGLDDILQSLSTLNINK
jgi:hypothetical protein